jgi:hypothetical protein
LAATAEGERLFVQVDTRSKLERALDTRDVALALLRQRGEWLVRGDIPFLMVRGRGFTIALRTPFQRMPNAKQQPEKRSLPYGLEIYAPKRVLDIAWDHAGSVALSGYEPGEWEWALKAGEL